MKRHAFLLGLLLLPSLAGCGSSSLPALTIDLNADTVLRLGQNALVRGETATVRLDKILEDSRCPVGADCISAGRIRVRVRVTSARGSFTQEASLPPPEVTIEQPSGYTVALTAVEPSNFVGRTIPGEEYRFTVKVTKSP